MREDHQLKLNRLLNNITDMISDANQCRDELRHIKIYHNETETADLAAQFSINERIRHIEKIEKRLDDCLRTLKKHYTTVADLLNIKSYNG